MSYQDSTTRNGEILSVEDEKLRQMIGDLNRVNAPKDFDFRLKARIANAKPDEFKPKFLPVLRYVLPLSAILLIFTAFVFNGFYTVDNQSLATVEQPSAQPLINEIDSSPVSTPEKQPEKNTETVSNESSIIAIPPVQAVKTTIREEEGKPLNKTRLVAGKSPDSVSNKDLTVKEEVKEEDKSGSRDIASTTSLIITPNGVNLNSTTNSASNPEISKSVEAREILTQIGIEASFEELGWKVKSVKQFSLAERSGIKSGDVIETINGEKVTAQILSAKSVVVKTLMVLRGAEKIEISLRVNDK